MGSSRPVVARGPGRPYGGPFPAGSRPVGGPVAREATASSRPAPGAYSVTFTGPSAAGMGNGSACSRRLSVQYSAALRGSGLTRRETT